MATDTLTDNELIAEFMEVPKLEDYKGIMYDFQKTGKQIYSIRANELAYHRSWDWLIPVVAKCNELCKETGYPDNLELPQWHIMSVASNVKLVYFSVVEFIKWYNQQQKP